MDSNTFEKIQIRFPEDFDERVRRVGWNGGIQSTYKHVILQEQVEVSTSPLTSSDSSSKKRRKYNTKIKNVRKRVIDTKGLSDVLPDDYLSIIGVLWIFGYLVDFSLCGCINCFSPNVTISEDTTKIDGHRWYCKNCGKNWTVRKYSLFESLTYQLKELTIGLFYLLRKSS